MDSRRQRARWRFAACSGAFDLVSDKMKKRYCVLIVGMVFLLIAGCGRDDSLAGKIPKPVTEENLEYYVDISGSSSLCVRSAVYPYDGQLIFVAAYFNCGKELVETRILSEKERTAFWEEVNAVRMKEQMDDDHREGAQKESGGLSVGGVYYPVERIDFAALGIPVKKAHDVEYPLEEEAGGCGLEGILELQDTVQWKERPIFIGTNAFVRSVREQMEDRLGKEIEAMELDGLSDQDLTIKVRTEGGDSYQATVTYMCYVAEIVKE